MRKHVATAVIALAALVTPVAIGQSIDPMKEMAAGSAQAVQIKASSFFAARQASTSASLDSGNSTFNPDPVSSWLMALAVFGIIAVRRMRS